MCRLSNKHRFFVGPLVPAHCHVHTHFPGHDPIPTRLRSDRRFLTPQLGIGDEGRLNGVETEREDVPIDRGDFDQVGHAPSS